MGGCLKGIGCVVVLLVVAIAGWMTRDMWMPKVTGSARDTVSAAPTWQSLKPDGGQRARSALQKLNTKSGPVFVNVAPGDLAAYVMQELTKALPRAADSVEAAAIGDRLYVRAIVNTKDLGGGASLGPLAMLLGDRERVQLGGTLHVIRPGLTELQVKEIRIKDLNLPQPLIPRLIRQISRADRPAGLAPDGIALKTPDYMADVRVSNGKITLYKSTP